MASQASEQPARIGTHPSARAAGLASQRPRRRAAGNALMPVALAALAATDVVLIEAGGFPLALFWPAWLLIALAGLQRPAPPADWRMLGAWRAAALLMVLSAIVSAAASKPTSLALSAMFMAFGWWCARQSTGMEATATLRMLHGVLAAYALSTLLAAVMLSVGINESPLPALVKWTYDKNADAFRLQGLSSEPSYAAIVVGVAWLAALRLECQRQRPGGSAATRLWRAMLPWTLLLLAMVLSFLSVYGYLMLVIAGSALLPPARRPARLLAAGAAVLLALAALMSQADADSRVLQIASGIAALDLDTWMLVDGSSFMRVGPLFHYMMTADPTSLGFWLGHGAASSTQFFGDAFGGLAGKDVDSIQPGFLPAFLYDWGLLTGLAVLRLGFLACRGPYALQGRLAFVLMLFNANLNTLLFWWVVAAMLASAPTLQRRPAVRRRMGANVADGPTMPTAAATPNPPGGSTATTPGSCP